MLCFPLSSSRTSVAQSKSLPGGILHMEFLRVAFVQVNKHQRHGRHLSLVSGVFFACADTAILQTNHLEDVGHASVENQTLARSMYLDAIAGDTVAYLALGDLYEDT